MRSVEGCVRSAQESHSMDLMAQMRLHAFLFPGPTLAAASEKIVSHTPFKGVHVAHWPACTCIVPVSVRCSLMNHPPGPFHQQQNLPESCSEQTGPSLSLAAPGYGSRIVVKALRLSVIADWVVRAGKRQRSSPHGATGQFELTDMNGTAVDLPCGCNNFLHVRRRLPFLADFLKMF